MTIEMAVDILRSVLTTAMLLISPLLGAAITIGVTVSLLQSITSIQEQTLTFVPKLVGVGAVLIVSSNWMIRTLMEFTISFIQRMADMGP